MNVFVAGIHGVGKTYLASAIAPSLNMLHTSASKLIAEERMAVNWDANKRVPAIAENQLALIAAVRRHNNEGRTLLLDGHFVLLNGEGQMTPIDPPVFEALGLDGVLLIEADVSTVVARIQTRDGHRGSLQQTAEFMTAEHAQAEKVCRILGIPLLVLSSPSAEELADAIQALRATSRP